MQLTDQSAKSKRRGSADPNINRGHRNKALGISLYRELNHPLIATLSASYPLWRQPVKLNNLKIAPKLGILVGMTLVGLFAAGVLASYLVQREMLNARIDQTHTIVELARNMALGLQQEVEAGKLTKEQAIAEFAKRANTMTHENGANYLFGYTMDGTTLISPDPKAIGTNRLDVLVGGRAVSRELRDGVAAYGEVTLFYEREKAGAKELERKVGYAAAIPNWNMYIGTGAYLNDIDDKRVFAAIVDVVDREILAELLASVDEAIRAGLRIP